MFERLRAHKWQMKARLNLSHDLGGAVIGNTGKVPHVTHTWYLDLWQGTLKFLLTVSTCGGCAARFSKSMTIFQPRLYCKICILPKVSARFLETICCCLGAGASALAAELAAYYIVGFVAKSDSSSPKSCCDYAWNSSMVRYGADSESGVVFPGDEFCWKRSGTLKGMFDAGWESQCLAYGVWWRWRWEKGNWKYGQNFVRLEAREGE